MDIETAIPATKDGEASLASATPVTLDHSWPPGLKCERTVVRVSWDSGGLWVRAEMEDREVTTRATADSQHLWELGDVFEVFLEAEDAGFYTEMHVAPGNYRLHLRIRPTDYETLKNKTLSLFDLMIRPPAFECRSAITPTGWTVGIRIPAASVDPKGVLTLESRWRASFCRYDAWSDGRPPLISSTSPHKEPNFHRCHEWRPLCF